MADWPTIEEENCRRAEKRGALSPAISVLRSETLHRSCSMSPLPIDFAVQGVLDRALLADPDAEVWFVPDEALSRAIPIAGVAARRLPGAVCLLSQLPAIFSFELVAALSGELAENDVYVWVTDGGDPTLFQVHWARVIAGTLFLGGPSLPPRNAVLTGLGQVASPESSVKSGLE
jgi:hypothetical protein